MRTTKETLQQIQSITFDAYKSSGQAAALLGEPASSPEAIARTLEQTAASLEQGTVELRGLCESCLPELLTIGRKPVLPPLEVAGTISVNEFGWLMLELNTLLPHCRFSTPAWLTDTITRLLDQHKRRRGRLPKGGSAPFVGPEHEAAGGDPEPEEPGPARSAEPALLGQGQPGQGASTPSLEVPEPHFKECRNGTSASAGTGLQEVPDRHPSYKL